MAVFPIREATGAVSKKQYQGCPPFLFDKFLKYFKILFSKEFLEGDIVL